jgi:hypothetical protein
MRTALTPDEIHRAYPAGYTFSLFGPAVAWFVHLVASAIVAEWGCIAGMGAQHLLGISIVAWLVFSLSIATVLFSVLAIVSAGKLKRALLNHEATHTKEATSSAFLIEVAWLSGWLFVLIILAQTIPILYFFGGC